MSTEHPEATCQECGGSNSVWWAPNDLWNAVLGTPDNPRAEGVILCPTCFTAKAGGAYCGANCPVSKRAAMSDSTSLTSEARLRTSAQASGSDAVGSTSADSANTARLNASTSSMRVMLPQDPDTLEGA